MPSGSFEKLHWTNSPKQSSLVSAQTLHCLKAWIMCLWNPPWVWYLVPIKCWSRLIFSQSYFFRRICLEEKPTEWNRQKRNIRGQKQWLWRLGSRLIPETNSYNEGIYKESSKWIARERKKESELIAHFNFDDRLSGKLPPGRTETSFTTNNMNHFWILNCHQTACFCELGIDKKSMRIDRFLQTFHNRNAHRANVF